MSNELDPEDNTLADEMEQTICSKCSEALAFLAVIIGDRMLDLSF